MTNRELVERKLAYLREHLSRARRRAPPSLEALVADIDRTDALVLSLFVSVQEAIDIAYHVGTDNGWGTPESYAASFELLVTHDVLDASVATQMIGASGFRNRIAHAYGTLDLQRLYRDLPGALDALEAFAKAIASYLLGSSSSGGTSSP
jgi:uncharacterized protein YutE (UPF0331/DUF86 family)